jgi:predicted nucleotidyltransferase
MTPADAQALTELVAKWVRSRADLKSLGLAGSWARGAARPDSDIDLIVLADKPSDYRADRSWLSAVLAPDFSILSDRDESYGIAWSLRALLEPRAEIELTFAPLDWAAIPIDPGTRRVVGDGFRVILDKDRRLQRLVDAVRALP